VRTPNGDQLWDQLGRGVPWCDEPLLELGERFTARMVAGPAAQVGSRAAATCEPALARVADLVVGLAHVGLAQLGNLKRGHGPNRGQARAERAARASLLQAKEGGADQPDAVLLTRPGCGLSGRWTRALDPTSCWFSGRCRPVWPGDGPTPERFRRTWVDTNTPCALGATWV